MAGPNSAPNGDRSLVSSEKIFCVKHGDKLEKCSDSCELLRKRDILSRSGLLRTGKTK